MKQLKLLACALALGGSIALFTGCGGGGDNGGGGNNPPAGTNAPPSVASSTITLTPSDGTGDNVVTTDAAGNYHATFSNPAGAEDGTYAYTPNGDNATLVLTPTTADGVSTINLTFANSTSGTYTSDTVGSGSFTVTSNAPSTP